jgi:hypothetical protein
MSRSPTDNPHSFAPILSWDQIRDALIHVTTPESKLALIPSVLADLRRTSENPRAFALTLAVQITLLADPFYDIDSRGAPVN